MSPLATLRPAALLIATLLVAALPASAQFAAAVNPPRFEIAVEPGATSRQVIEITQALPGSATYRVYTTDWTMDASGALTFYDVVQPGSCRSWVAIERREVTVTNGTRARYRFEVAPLADARPQECRFAVMIESVPQDVPSGDSSFPMSGRIAVIVYASVGGARPELETSAVEPRTVDGKSALGLTVHNRGNATGRLGGILQGRDAAGVTVELAPEAVPILPGQTRRIALQRYEPPARSLAASLVDTRPGPELALSWPVTVKGTLEYGPQGVGRLDVDRVFGPTAGKPAP